MGSDVADKTQHFRIIAETGITTWRAFRYSMPSATLQQRRRPCRCSKVTAGRQNWLFLGGWARVGSVGRLQFEFNRLNGKVYNLCFAVIKQMHTNGEIVRYE